MTATIVLAQVRYVRNIPIQLPLTDLYDPQYTPKQIYPTPDGGVIILGDCLAHYGEYPDQGTAADCGAIKLDANGNCQWQWWSRDFIGWGDPSIVAIDQEADGRVNFIINNQPFYFRLGWITPQETSFLQAISIPSAGVNKALRLPNGDIFAIGGINSSSFFMRLNTQGDTLSTRSYPADSLWIQPGLRFAVAYDMELDTDGMPVASCQFTDRFASVVKTDWNGNIIWRRDTNIPLCRGQDIPITKIPISNEIVFGYRAYNNNYRNQFSIYRVSGTGLDSLYTIQMSDTICVGSYYSIVGHSQGIYLSGFYGDYSIEVFNEAVHISSYDMQGQLGWDWSMVSPFNLDQPTDCITVLPDSSVVHVFGNDDFGDFGLTIVKLHPDGTATEDETIPKPEFTLCAYPNPMNDFIYLKITSNYRIKEKSIPIRIYNVKGQLVKTFNFTSKTNGVYESTWDGKDDKGKMCATGTYILKVKSDKKHISKKILLVK